MAGILPGRGVKIFFLIKCGICHFIRQAGCKMNCETTEEGGQANGIYYRLFLPPDFMKKEVNESVVFLLMPQSGKTFRLLGGDSPEPDFIADGEGHRGHLCRWAGGWKPDYPLGPAMAALIPAPAKPVRLVA